MDPSMFSSQPADPGWEQPRFRDLHVHQIKFSHSGTDRDAASDGINPPEPPPLTDRAKALDAAAMELNTLCASNAPLADVKAFLKNRERAPEFPISTRGSDDLLLQPNALAWFNDTNAVQWACQNDHRDLVELLLEKGLEIKPRAVIHAVTKMKETKDCGTVQLLLDHGWDINKPFDEDSVPIMGMVVDDHELVQWCLARGAEANVASASGRTIMGRAASYASVDTLKLLFEKAGDLSSKGALVAAASLSHTEGSPGRLEVVRFVVDRGASLDAFYMDGRPESDHCCEWLALGGQNALHIAIWGGKRDMVELLIKLGADTNVPVCSMLKTDGQTLSPVELTKRYGHQVFNRKRRKCVPNSSDII
ncbi:ankyrin repeat-containing domain protein [Apiospora marii]|uniref:Ankyrin repeat-containing domain protein n=1 Tax=Apiospora marii TaxID=335849 RepID=A0ABR1RG19_9PEZI